MHYYACSTFRQIRRAHSAAKPSVAELAATRFDWKSGDICVISSPPIPGAKESKQNTISNAGIHYGIISTMDTKRKITVEVPEKLLEKAQEASGEGITRTVRTGLQLVAASQSYARLRALRGKVKFSRTAKELKDDR